MYGYWTAKESIKRQTELLQEELSQAS